MTSQCAPQESSYLPAGAFLIPSTAASRSGSKATFPTRGRSFATANGGRTRASPLRSRVPSGTRVPSISNPWPLWTGPSRNFPGTRFPRGGSTSTGRAFREGSNFLAPCAFPGGGSRFSRGRGGNSFPWKVRAPSPARRLPSNSRKTFPFPDRATWANSGSLPVTTSSPAIHFSPSALSTSPPTPASSIPSMSTSHCASTAIFPAPAPSCATVNGSRIRGCPCGFPGTSGTPVRSTSRSSRFPVPTATNRSVRFPCRNSPWAATPSRGPVRSPVPPSFRVVSSSSIPVPSFRSGFCGDLAP